MIARETSLGMKRPAAEAALTDADPWRGINEIGFGV